MNRAVTAFSSPVLLTMDDVRKWRAEREKFVSEIKEIETKIEALDRRLKAATLFVHPDQLAELSEPLGANKPAERGSWTGTILGAVEDAGRGITYDELRIAILDTPLAGRLEEGTKAMYGAASKLLLTKRIMKHGDKLYSLEASNRYREAVAVGLAEDEDTTVRWRSPMAESAMAFAKGHPHGFTSNDVIEHLCETPEFEGPIRRNPTHAYNVLNRLVRRGGLMKKGRIYFPLHRNEAPDVQPSEPLEIPHQGDQTGAD